MRKTEPSPEQTANRLLALLPRADYQRLTPHLQAVPLAPKQIVYKARSPIDYVYFPSSGVVSAMTIVHALEGAPRGVYAGCFGWVGQDGRADLAMAIRSILFDGDGASVGAGGGITWRSDPAAEVAEVALKARAPLAAVGAALPSGW